ncbi:MAG: hypothetical protein Q6352_010080 [Candidatus Freyrarchaeum guaymaensis]
MDVSLFFHRGLVGNLILARETIDFLLPEKTSIDAYTDAMSSAEKGLK